MIILFEKVDINFWAVYSLHSLLNNMEETFTEVFTTAINMLSLIEREHQATIKALEESHKKHIKLLCDVYE